MPRPVKCRRVCCMPRVNEFAPKKSSCRDKIVITVEEYEALRLIDYRGFTQEECSSFMNVSRATAQQIYKDARKKVAVAIVEGKTLVIDGGDYTLCDGKEESCSCGGCRKHNKIKL